MGPYVPLWVFLGPLRFDGSLSVFVGSYGSLWVFIGAYGSL